MQGEAKVDAVAEYAADLLEQEIPVVIFAHHRNVIASLATKLTAYTPLVITGDTPAKDRASYVTQFQEGQTNLIIGNFQAMGTGITLTRSSDVILAELDWIPATVAQAVDRTHRIGQAASQVTIHYFTVKDSIDEALTTHLIRRTREFEKVMDSTHEKITTKNQAIRKSRAFIVKEPLTFPETGVKDMASSGNNSCSINGEQND